eukprot:CAMPEP_0119557166 /NCGR_PEP_ID=MMETSP1352-20130426/8919_1 /TAXON_ID=265584 /ORGANISM="Stauroneis constricta, Strain CCMP1120" /LENGTH=60 /DNA_ID=CAMNT_0007604221 /DNA_START=12 /DNA_END=191 /DNA_ORIENTATION=+
MTANASVVSDRNSCLVTGWIVESSPPYGPALSAAMTRFDDAAMQALAVLVVRAAGFSRRP